MSSEMNILVTSVGRRVGLLACLGTALETLGLHGLIHAADAQPDAAAARFADVFHLTPRADSPDYLACMLEICRKHRVRLVIPLLDVELPLYAAARGRFAEQGVTVAVSKPETVEIGADKRRTNAWLRQRGFPTVRQAALGELGAGKHLHPPLIVKPARGSGSIGVRRIESWQQAAALDRDPSLIAEEIAPGLEYTVHGYVDRCGACRTVVPCRRLEVRAGEVSKGLTVKHAALIRLVRGVAEALPGAWGPLNVQCFVDRGDSIRVIEINPRLGGGYPLVDRAGARFMLWMIEEVLGRPLEAKADDWRDDLAMLRYDEAVYLPGVEIRAGKAFGIARGT
jgi:carbamoyl-phosphate synthase large subunit